MTEPVVEVFVGLLATYTIVELFFGRLFGKDGLEKCVWGGQLYRYIYIANPPQ